MTALQEGMSDQEIAIGLAVNQGVDIRPLVEQGVPFGQIARTMSGINEEDWQHQLLRQRQAEANKLRLGDVERGLKQGIATTKQGVAGFGGVLGSLAKYAGEKLGIDIVKDTGSAVQDFSMDKYAQYEDEASQYPTLSLDEVKGIGTGVDWFQGLIASQVPIIAETIIGTTLSAGVGYSVVKHGLRKMVREKAKAAVAHQIKNKVIKETAREATEKQLEKALLKGYMKASGRKTVAKLTKAGMVGTVSQLEAGLNYGELLTEHGVDAPMSSLGFGVLSGLMELAGGNIGLVDDFVGAIAKGMPGSYLKRAAKKLLTNIPSEMLQEAGQEVSSILNIVANTDEKFLTPENIKRIVESGVSGGAIGGAGAFVAATKSGIKKDLSVPDSIQDEVQQEPTTTQFAENAEEETIEETEEEETEETTDAEEVITEEDLSDMLESDLLPARSTKPYTTKKKAEGALKIRKLDPEKKFKVQQVKGGFVIREDTGEAEAAPKKTPKPKKLSDAEVIKLANVTEEDWKGYSAAQKNELRGEANMKSIKVETKGLKKETEEVKDKDSILPVPDTIKWGKMSLAQKLTFAKKHSSFTAYVNKKTNDTGLPKDKKEVQVMQAEFASTVYSAQLKKQNTKTKVGPYVQSNETEKEFTPFNAAEASEQKPLSKFQRLALGQIQESLLDENDYKPYPVIMDGKKIVGNFKWLNQKAIDAMEKEERPKTGVTAQTFKVLEKKGFIKRAEFDDGRVRWVPIDWKPKFKEKTITKDKKGQVKSKEKTKVEKPKTKKKSTKLPKPKNKDTKVISKEQSELDKINAKIAGQQYVLKHAKEGGAHKDVITDTKKIIHDLKVKRLHATMNLKKSQSEAKKEESSPITDKKEMSAAIDRFFGGTPSVKAINKRIAELKGMLTEYKKKDPEFAKQIEDKIRELESQSEAKKKVEKSEPIDSQKSTKKKKTSATTKKAKKSSKPAKKGSKPKKKVIKRTKAEQIKIRGVESQVVQDMQDMGIDDPLSKVEAVDYQEDLPDGVKKEFNLEEYDSTQELDFDDPKYSKGEKNRVAGVYWKGKLYLVLENLVRAGGAKGVILHEGGHLLLASDKQFKAMYNSFIASAAKRIKTDKVLLDIHNWVKEQYPSKPEVWEEETLMHYIQNEANTKLPFYKEMVFKLKAWLKRKLGMTENLSGYEMGLIVGNILRNKLGHTTLTSSAPLASRVYHGSPVTWQKESRFKHGRPRLDKMSTGSGVQTYGWGFYGAQMKATGLDYYKYFQFPAYNITGVTVNGKKIKFNPTAYNTKILFGQFVDANTAEDIALAYVGFAFNGTTHIHDTQEIYEDALWYLDIELEALRRDQASFENARLLPLYDQAGHLINAWKLKQAKINFTRSTNKDASLYKLEMPSPAISQLFHWDRTLGQQKPMARAKMHKLINSVQRKNSVPYKNKLHMRRINNNTLGSYIYRAVSKALGSDKAASLEFKKFGIPGLRFIDGWTRYKRYERKTFNYVIWDQKILNQTVVKKRNDIPLASKIIKFPAKSAYDKTSVNDRIAITPVEVADRVYYAMRPEVFKIWDAATGIKAEDTDVQARKKIWNAKQALTAEIGIFKFREYTKLKAELEQRYDFLTSGMIAFAKVYDDAFGGYKAKPQGGMTTPGNITVLEKAKDRKNADILPLKPPTKPKASKLAPKFSSRLEDDFIQAKGPGKATPENWLNTFKSWTNKSMPIHVKEEFFFSNLREWMQKQKGKVTKQQVMDHLAKYGLKARMDETVLGGRDITLFDQLHEEGINPEDYIAERASGFSGPAVNRVNELLTKPINETEYPDINGDFNKGESYTFATLIVAVDDKYIVFRDIIRDKLDNLGVYPEVRDHLLINVLNDTSLDSNSLRDSLAPISSDLMSKQSKDFLLADEDLVEDWRIIRDAVQDQGYLTEVQDALFSDAYRNAPVEADYVTLPTATGLKDYQEIIIQIPAIKDTELSKKGKHFRLENEVVHLRVSSIGDGLYIHEIQSDTHQDAKKYGYTDKKTYDKNTLKLRQLTEPGNAKVKHYVNYIVNKMHDTIPITKKNLDDKDVKRNFKIHVEGRFFGPFGPYSPAIYVDAEDLAINIIRGLSRDVRKSISVQDVESIIRDSKVMEKLIEPAFLAKKSLRAQPDLPFKDNSTQLALKRAVMEAVALGHTKLIWAKTPYHVAAIEGWPSNFRQDADGKWIYDSTEGIQIVDGIVKKYTEYLPQTITKLFKPYGGGKLTTTKIKDYAKAGKEFNSFEFNQELIDTVSADKVPLAAKVRTKAEQAKLDGEILGDNKAEAEKLFRDVMKDQETSKVPLRAKIAKLFNNVIDESDKLDESDGFTRKAHEQNIGIMGLLFNSPEYYLRRGAQAKKVMSHALREDNLKYTIEKFVLGNWTNLIKNLKKTSGYKKAYKIANDYLLQTDATGRGYSVKTKSTVTKTENAKVVKTTWLVMNPSNKVVGRAKTEEEATRKMISFEQQMLKKRKFNQASLDMVKEARLLTDRGFTLLTEELRRQVASAKENGLKAPTAQYTDDKGKTRQLAISQLITRIGDLRGTYFPRERQSKAYVLKAEHSNGKLVTKTYSGYLPQNVLSSPWVNKTRQLINTRMPVGVEARRLKALGYDVSIKVTPTPTDVIFDVPGLITSMDSLLKNAEENVKKDADTKVLQSIHNQMAQNIADVYKIKGRLTSRKQRSKRYYAGFETDMNKAFTSYAQRLAAGEARRTTTRNMLLAFTGRETSFKDWQKTNKKGTYTDYLTEVKKKAIDPTTQKGLYKATRLYMQFFLKPDTGFDRAVGYFKALAVVMYLGGRVSSAAVNLTNMVLAVPATITGYTGLNLAQSGKHVANSVTQYTKYRAGLSKKLGIHSLVGSGTLSAEDKAIFDYITSQGWDEANFNYEAARVIQGIGSRVFNEILKHAMVMFGATEKVNRATTIFAAYKALRQSDKEMYKRINTTLNSSKDPKLIEKAHKELLQHAKEISSQAHGTYGKAAKPWVIQKIRLLDLPFTFMKFQHNYILNMLDLGLNKKQIIAPLYMLMAPALLAGVPATMLTTLIKAMWPGHEDPEERFYQFIEDLTGSDTIARTGLIGATTGIDMTGSLQMNSPFPKKVIEIGGAPLAIWSDFAKAYEHFTFGETEKGLEDLAPRALGNIIKGKREFTEGLTTGSYAPVYHGTTPLKSTPYEVILRLFSFSPSRLSAIRDRQWSETQERREYTADRSDILRRYNRFYTLPLYKQDPEILMDLADKIRAYNNAVYTSKPKLLIPYITGKWLNRNLKQTFKPNKYEKQRSTL